MAKKKRRVVRRKQPQSIISDEITIPNHSGEHTAGTTGTPIQDLHIANKKYVDDVCGVPDLDGGTATSNYGGVVVSPINGGSA